ncbi:MAG: SDR family NAD(P)-dependent oxidoreductase [Actinomycetota bacterium]|nr:SDR family NAD(P)-dependent oxidoreductase [Actinomycetota bacterium]
MRAPLNRIVDGALELSVVGSFSDIGYRVRRRVDDWDTIDRRNVEGRAVLVTGTTSGLGRATAARLAGMGARVWLGVRDAERGAKVRDELRDATGNDEIRLMVADLGDLPAVRDAAAGVVEEAGALDAVVHNAGALTDQRRETAAGIELTLATHVVGPYVLTRAVQDALAPGARIVFVSSGGMYTQGFDLDRLEMDADAYRGAVAYARAKRAQVVLSRALAAELRGRAVSHAMHPGWANTPGIGDSLPGFSGLIGPILRSAEHGADTIVWLVGSEEAGRTTGLFWLDRRPRSTVRIPGRSAPPDAEGELVRWLDERVRRADAVTTG